MYAVTFKAVVLNFSSTSYSSVTLWLIFPKDSLEYTLFVKNSPTTTFNFCLGTEVTIAKLSVKISTLRMYIF